MLEKKITIDLIETLENGCVQVRAKTSVFEDDKELSYSYHRHVVSPGDDYSQEDARVQAICAAVHTPEVIAAYQATLITEQQI
jgi:hypothetical protein